MYFTEEVKVTSYDCDFRNRLKISSAMRYMQETARQHLVWLGFPADVLAEEDMVFLLSKLTMKIHRIPEIREEIVIGTAPTHTKGVRFIREFVMDSKDGERLISAVSQWPLIQISSRKVLRPKDFNRDLSFQPESASEYIQDIPFPKIEMPQEVLYSEEIKYSELDINNHVNNAVYGDFICDAMPFELMSEADINTFTVGFQNEAVIDDTIAIRRHAIADNEYFVTGNHSRAECFKGLVTFK